MNASPQKKSSLPRQPNHRRIGMITPKIQKIIIIWPTNLKFCSRSFIIIIIIIIFLVSPP